MNRRLIFVFALSLAIAATALAQYAPREVSDLVGSRVASGESSLKNRGYRYVKGYRDYDRSTANWWNGSNQACISVVTYNGRYESINASSSADCNQNNSGGDWGGGNQASRPPSWAVGNFYSTDGQISLRVSQNGYVTAVNDGESFSGTYSNGRIYLNGDSSTISRDRNGVRTYNTNSRQTTVYTRGNDNGDWDNDDNDDGDGNWNGNNGGQMSRPPSWARGTFYSSDGQITITMNDDGRVSVVNGGQSYYGRYYQDRLYLNNDVSTVSKNGNGIRTYNQNTNQTTYYTRSNNGYGYGNNNAKANLNDLIGARTSDGDAQSRNRGFRLVDTTNSGNNTYKMFWRRQSSQCIQITIVDDQYLHINDIGSHPKCR